MNDCLVKKYVESDRGRTFYWVSKKENAVTLVMLPGLTADHRLFEKQVEAFQSDYGLLVWDCPCHGESRPYDSFTYANVTEELKRILTMENINRAIFIGQSLGGMIAQYFIDRYPDMALGFLSIDSAPFGDYYSKSDYFWLKQLEWMCRMFPDSMLRNSMAKLCGSTPYSQNKMKEMLSVYPKRELCHLMYIGEAAFIPENRSITLSCPAMLLLGENDKVGKVSQYNKSWSQKAGIPLHIIKGAAHNANDDCPEEVNEIIKQFIRKI